MHRIYLINKKANMEALLAKQKEKIEKLPKYTERINSNGNDNGEENMNLNSVMNNMGSVREKKKWGIKKNESSMNSELQGNGRDLG